MSAVPLVFDRRAVRARQQRAIGQGGSNFLLARVADDLLDRLGAVQRSFRRVLDLGTPGPEAAAALAASLPEAMVVRAASVRADGPAAVLRLIADEEFSPFRPEAFDLTVSLLALHTANDLPGALTQIRRSLQPDGLFLGALVGGQTLQELRQVMAEAEVEFTGGASPRVFPFADLRDLGHLLQRAGFALPVTDLDRLTVRYDDLFALLRDLRAMGATNTLVARSRRPAARRLFLRAAELYAARFADADGRIRATFDVIWLSGWAPHESQQKPLAPGSARMRLADALHVREGRLT